MSKQTNKLVKLVETITQEEQGSATSISELHQQIMARLLDSKDTVLHEAMDILTWEKGLFLDEICQETASVKVEQNETFRLIAIPLSIVGAESPDQMPLDVLTQLADTIKVHLLTPGSHLLLLPKLYTFRHLADLEYSDVFTTLQTFSRQHPIPSQSLAELQEFELFTYAESEAPNPADEVFFYPANLKFLVGWISYPEGQLPAWETLVMPDIPSDEADKLVTCINDWAEQAKELIQPCVGKVVALQVFPPADFYESLRLSTWAILSAKFSLNFDQVQNMTGYTNKIYDAFVSLHRLETHLEIRVGLVNKLQNVLQAGILLEVPLLISENSTIDLALDIVEGWETKFNTFHLIEAIQGPALNELNEQTMFFISPTTLESVFIEQDGREEDEGDSGEKPRLLN